MGERFSGILVQFAKMRLDGDTKAAFLAMNQALKARAEKGTSSGTGPEAWCLL